MKFNNKKINFLDCTLRDGGYYNDWNFSREIISDYLYDIFSKNRYNIMGKRDSCRIPSIEEEEYFL